MSVLDHGLVAAILCLLAGSCTGANAQASGQVVREDDGGIFMEEVGPPASAPRRSPRNSEYQDLSNAGVKIDSAGKIIPLIQRQGGPVMPEYSDTMVYDEPWWMFAPPVYATPFSPWAVPYGAWRAPFGFPGVPSTAFGQYYPGAPFPPVGPVGPIPPVGPIGPVGPISPVSPVFPYGLPWGW